VNRGQGLAQILPSLMTGFARWWRAPTRWLEVPRLRERNLFVATHGTSVEESAKQRASRKMVCVVTFLSNAQELTPDEEISVRHMRKFLGDYDTYAIAPEGSSLEIPGFQTVRISRNFFGNVQNHTAFVLSPRLYEMFSEYDFLLLHHLDALPFSDELVHWCNAGYDYLAGPYWGIVEQDWVMGCGGFSLRRVSSFSKLYRSRVPTVDPEEAWRTFRKGRSTAEIALNYPRRFLKRLHMFNNIQRDIQDHLKHGSWYEDVFVAYRAQHYMPEIRIAPLDEGFRFAFSGPPERCIEKTGGVMPFGCHAWPKWRSFFEPYLLKSDEPEGVGTAG
jgi:hypothetical protein